MPASRWKNIHASIHTAPGEVHAWVSYTAPFFRKSHFPLTRWFLASFINSVFIPPKKWQCIYNTPLCPPSPRAAKPLELQTQDIPDFCLTRESSLGTSSGWLLQEVRAGLGGLAFRWTETFILTVCPLFLNTCFSFGGRIQMRLQNACGKQDWKRSLFWCQNNIRNLHFFHNKHLRELFIYLRERIGVFVP